MTHTTFPCEAWDTATPGEAGFASDRLAAVKTWLDQRVEDRRYRFALVRCGKLVADWCNNAEPGDRLEIASTWKSMLSNVLGIAVAEGKLPSVDAEVYDYWPDFMAVPEAPVPKKAAMPFRKTA